MNELTRVRAFGVSTSVSFWLIVSASGLGCDKSQKPDESSSAGTGSVEASGTVSATMGSDEAAATTSSSSGGTAGTEDCNPANQPNSGGPSGMEVCQPSEAINRIMPASCAPTPPLTANVDPDGCGACDRFPVPATCVTEPSVAEPFCHYDCTTDADCGPGAACQCAIEGLTTFNVCVEATCWNADDCELGCGLGSGCWLPSALHCRAEDDECAGHGDCPLPSESDEHCAWNDPQQTFRCDDWSECG